MKILLVDVDSKIPNLALMKISTEHKNYNYQVDLKCLGLDYYKSVKNKLIIDGSGYDKVFISIIFSNNKNAVTVINNNTVLIGGSGYDIYSKLDSQIEHSNPDYSLYPDNDTSYGFITRGCIRKCEFCDVWRKEGMIKIVDSVDNIVKHKKVKFLDNNILAYSEHKAILKELVNKKIRCQFNQGLDIRLITEDNAELLSDLNYLGEYIFAFDNIEDEKIINHKLKIVKQFIIKNWKLKFFIYTHPDMDLKNDVLYRIKWCKENKVLPYIMRHRSCWGSEHQDFYTDLSAYGNQPSLFKKMCFDEFLEKRHTNKERIAYSKRLNNGYI